MSEPTLVTMGLNEPVYLAASSVINYAELVQSMDTFGRLILPSVYGKDLSAFEVASSGKIVLTLNDEHAVDIYSDSAFVFIQPTASNSIAMSLSNDLAHIILNTDSCAVDIAASNDIFISAGEVIQIATGQNQSVISMQNSNLYMTSTGVLAMSSANQQSYISIDTASNNINVYSCNDCTIYSGQEVVIRATSLKIQVDEFDVSYSFTPQQNGSLNLYQTLPDKINGGYTNVKVARFGIPAVL